MGSQRSAFRRRLAQENDCSVAARARLLSTVGFESTLGSLLFSEPNPNRLGFLSLAPPLPSHGNCRWPFFAEQNGRVASHGSREGLALATEEAIVSTADAGSFFRLAP